MKNKCLLEQEWAIYEQNLPWSIEVISLLTSGEYVHSFRTGAPGNIGLLNKYNEWVIFCSNNNALEIILKYINRLGKIFRVVIFSKQCFDTFVVDKYKSFHIEDLMCCNAMPRDELKGFRIAGKDDVQDIVKLQSQYCLEEVSWKYYHKDASQFQIEYLKLVKDGRVFVIEKPARSKIEVGSRYLGHVRIRRFYTDSLFRRRGYGQACLDGFLSYNAPENVKVSLNVRRDNVIAKQIYLKSGFKIIGQVLYLISGRENSIIV